MTRHSPQLAVRIDRLVKHYGDTEALRGVTFDVREGSVFGLIGPNGSGKSTLIRSLLGLSEPTRGETQVYGESSLSMSRATRQRIGYLSETSIDDHGLSLGELLRYFASFFDVWDWDRCNALASRIDVPMDRSLAQMSAGQRRRAELVATLAHDPDLLVLDDPAVGLDATVRREFLWAVLETARDEGKTVLFTSHVLHDVERIVDTVAILQDGKIRMHDELDVLIDRTKRLVFRDTKSEDRPRLGGELTREQRGQDLVVVTESFDRASLNGHADRVEVENMNLEDIFCAVSSEKASTEEVSS